MKFGVIVFPGSNCDDDMVYVLTDVMHQKAIKLWHKDHDLQNCDAIILPGGFSYGDYLRSGAIARFSPIMKEVIEFANNGGIVFGICNGFQILVESHLLPGALLHNTNQKYICKNVFIKPSGNTALLNASIPKDRVLQIPMAHGEGRYYADDHTLDQLKANGQVLFQYCDGSGAVTQESNPNGSSFNIAGVCNATKNVFGMMPHPERAAGPFLGNKDGELILGSLIENSLAGVRV